MEIQETSRKPGRVHCLDLISNLIKTLLQTYALSTLEGIFNGAIKLA